MLTYDELINAMIADSWYMVNEYRLNLGPRDTLEDLVIYARTITGLKSSEKQDKIIQAICESDDAMIKAKKDTLTKNVPYRLLAPFIGFSSEDFERPLPKVAEKINGYDNVIYRFERISGLSSIIRVDETWAKYITDNYGIITGWINYNLIGYLQRRNPSVPGIPNKLSAPQSRILEKAKKYWHVVSEVYAMEGHPLSEIYGGVTVPEKGMSIDHFVPWSYVAHDELWNLSPTTKSINSSKSNNLPDWNMYFARLAQLEYKAYDLTSSHSQVGELKGRYSECVDEHVNDLNVREKLYRPGLTEEQFINALEDIVKPVYNAALNLGFGVWTYT